MVSEKVDPIVWRRPRDGSPICALISVRLIAFGLPPDSVCILIKDATAKRSGKAEHS